MSSDGRMMRLWLMGCQKQLCCGKNRILHLKGLVLSFLYIGENSALIFVDISMFILSKVAKAGGSEVSYWVWLPSFLPQKKRSKDSGPFDLNCGTNKLLLLLDNCRSVRPYIDIPFSS